MAIKIKPSGHKSYTYRLTLKLIEQNVSEIKEEIKSLGESKEKILLADIMKRIAENEIDRK